jgi:hypothetical protein
MFQNAPNLSVDTVAEIVRLAVAPVFLLSGIASFVNVCTSRLSRIVDRSRELEPKLLGSRGGEHDRWLRELHVLDRRMSLVSWAISFSVLSAALICAVVVLLFSASLSKLHVATATALLFIGSMVAICVGFAIFLVETRIASRSVRVRTELLEHKVDEAE